MPRLKRNALAQCAGSPSPAVWLNGKRVQPGTWTAVNGGSLRYNAPLVSSLLPSCLGRALRLELALRDATPGQTTPFADIGR